MNATFYVRLAGWIGFAGVALGAFGAHGLKPLLEANGAVETWQKAVLYHLVHAVAIFAAASREPARAAPAWLWTAGIGIFSGSLYLLGATGAKWLGAVTPLGGLCLLAGWLVFALRGR